MRTVAIILALIATSCTTATDEPREGNEIASPQNSAPPLSVPLEQTTAEGADFTGLNKSRGNEGEAASSSELSQASTFYVARNTLRQPILPEGFTVGTLRAQQNCLVFEAGNRVFTAVVPYRARLSGQGQSWEMALDLSALRLGRAVNLAGGVVPSPGPESVVLERSIPSRCPQDMFAII